MPKLKIVVWEKKKQSEEPTVEVKIPSYLVRWLPKMMNFAPKRIREEIGNNINWEEMNFEELLNEAIEKGESEILDVKAEDTYVKIFVEK